MTTPNPPTYARAVLKISGESLGEDHHLDEERFQAFAEDIAAVHRKGLGVAVVVGGGNIFRGAQASEWSLQPEEADEVGMIATAINAKLLAGKCRAAGVPVDVFSRGPCQGVGRPWEREGVLAALDRHHVVVLAGGLGIPGISTDVPAVHVAVEVHADAVIMAKHGVDGAYNADPQVVPGAVKLLTITASEALERRLGVMDMAALQLAVDHRKCVHVVDAAEDKPFSRLLDGEHIGSTIIAI